MSERDWQEDFEHENGKYLCRCIECKRDFIAHKRRVLCRVCHREAVMTQAPGQHIGDLEKPK